MNRDELGKRLRLKFKSRVMEYFEKCGLNEADNLADMGIKSITDNLCKLQKLTDNPCDNLDEILYLTHTIKGILLNMGIFDLADKFDKIKDLKGEKLKFELEKLISHIVE